MLPDTVRVLSRGETETHGEIERQHHPERDRLAVQQPVAKPGLGLQRVSEGVAEIEQRPVIAGLALVGRDDLGLHAAADHDGTGQRRRFEIAHRASLGFEPFEEIGRRGSARI